MLLSNLLRRWVILAAALTMVACSGAPTSGDEAQAEPLTYGLTLVPSGIDPHIHASSELGIPLRSVYDTLVYRDAETLAFVPGLATSWTVSPDGLTYSFTLRDDVTFHDGTAFNAQAVQANLLRILDPATASQRARQLLGPVEAIDFQGDYQLSIRLSQPYAPLLDGLSQPYLGIASPTALAAHDPATYQFHQVGSGPYRFVEYVVNDRIVLERNLDYTWGPEVLVNPGIPAVERIIFRFYTDPATRAPALEGGEAQIMGELLPNDARRLSTDGSYRIEAVTVPGQPVQFVFNTSLPPTDSPTFRQALILATNRTAIAQALFQGYSPVAYGPLSSATVHFNPTLEGLNDYNPEQAVALLNSTDQRDSDGDGIRETADGSPLRVVLLVPAWGLYPEIGTLLESQWEDTLNIEVSIQRAASFPMLAEAARGTSEPVHAAGIHFAGLDPSVLNEMFRTGGTVNWFEHSDPQLDALLAAAQQEQNDQARRDLYLQIQERIIAESLILPIREQVNLNAAQPNISGLRYDPYGWFPYLADIGYGP